MKRTAWVSVGLLLLVSAMAAGASSVRSPLPEGPRARRVLLVSVDGLRPDLILRARTPTMRSLMARGSFTLWATTVAAAVTLPSHASMLTGVAVAKHGIDWNSDLPLEHPVYPNRPTLFEVAHGAGYTTALAAGKAKFAALARPGSLSALFVPGKTVSDSTVADTVVRWIRTSPPRVLFVHFPGVDVAGHASGWGSGPQLEAVATADRCLARVLDALAARHLLDSTVVLLTADHGGAGKSHGPDDPRSREIPWIIAGPGIRRDFDLGLLAELNVRTEDTFATVCSILAIAPVQDVDGREVREVREDPLEAGR